MILNNEFTVGAGLEDTWRLLTDLERVAPCMPGASITGREGDDFLGSSKIRVGPIGANFQGRARFLEQDDVAHAAVISMVGKDPKGAAAVNATVRARLEQVAPTATKVYVDTELDISGRMAQFGRGAIADVSSRLMGQFTTNLGAMIESPASSQAGEPSNGTAPVQPASAGTSAPSGELNALDLIGPVVLKNAAAPAIAFVLGWLVARAFPGRRGD